MKSLKLAIASAALLIGSIAAHAQAAVQNVQASTTVAASCIFTGATPGTLDFNASRTIISTALGSATRASFNVTVIGANANISVAVPTLTVAGVNDALTAAASQVFNAATGGTQLTASGGTAHSQAPVVNQQFWVAMTGQRAAGVFTATGVHTLTSVVTCG